MTSFRRGMVRDGGALSIITSPTHDHGEEFMDNANEFDARSFRQFGFDEPLSVKTVEKLKHEYVQGKSLKQKSSPRSLQEHILSVAPPVLFQSLTEQGYG